MRINNKASSSLYYLLWYESDNKFSGDTFLAFWSGWQCWGYWYKEILSLVFASTSYKKKQDTDVPHRLLEQKSFIKWVLATHSFKHSNQALGDRGKKDKIKTCLNFFDVKL